MIDVDDDRLAALERRGRFVGPDGHRVGLVIASLQKLAYAARFCKEARGWCSREGSPGA